MEIVVGTYDSVILGFRLIKVGQDSQIETSFTDNSHSGLVKCITVSNTGLLASGSSDETIRLLNLRKKKEMGSLVHHNGSITSLQFHKNHMFSTSEDKTFCVWKCGTWECLRTFKGHKSGLNCVSVHPSGKLALTVGRDRALHTWNLVKGRSAYITNIKQAADIVRWSPEGDRYITVTNMNIDVYSVETADVSCSIQSESRVNCAEFLNNDVLCYGGEGGTVYFHNIADNKCLHKCPTNTIRIKGLALSRYREDGDTEEKLVLVTGSSDGDIKLYTINHVQDGFKTEEFAAHNTGFRVTCMAVYSTNTSPTHTKHGQTKTEAVEVKTEETDIKIEPDDESDVELSKVAGAGSNSEESEDNSEESDKEPVQTVHTNKRKLQQTPTDKTNKKKQKKSKSKQDTQVEMVKKSNVSEGKSKTKKKNKKKKGKRIQEV